VEGNDAPVTTSEPLDIAVAQDAEQVDLAPLARLLLSLAKQHSEHAEQAVPQRDEGAVKTCRPRGPNRASDKNNESVH
jgi:hypothetical protein